jgi:hypothetical protein
MICKSVRENAELDSTGSGCIPWRTDLLRGKILLYNKDEMQAADYEIRSSICFVNTWFFVRGKREAWAEHLAYRQEMQFRKKDTSLLNRVSRKGMKILRTVRCRPVAMLLLKIPLNTEHMFRKPDHRRETMTIYAQSNLRGGELPVFV